MASVQCYKICEQSCQQHKTQQQHGSLGQKVTDLFKGHPNEGTQTQYCSKKTEVISQSGNLVSKSETKKCNQTFNNSGASSTTVKCQGRNRRQHKRNNLFQKIKDGISGHSSDSSSDESDSDNEHCHNRKN
ncbi:uncharacterized protein [Cicer arietinum]|uniref:Uncharacterized protein LOC101502259 n=1 Tax=Cicer arietinum TaxID=3827 RepID=A0A1S2YEH8_CICAR|nr:uncharacterized protein LOC101502259 [Cicer arietinum]